MALFRRKNTSDTRGIIRTDSNINSDIQKSEISSIMKSLKGKASNRDSLVVGLDVKNGNAINIDTNDILRTKNVLYTYSKDLLVQAIIRTRTNQVRRYARPARLSNDNVGYEVLPKDPSGKLGQPSSQQKNEAIRIEEFIQHTGKDYKPQRKQFPDFISQFVYNRYVYDQINVERVFRHDSDQFMNHFNIVDARNVVMEDIPKSVDTPRRFIQYPNRGNTMLGEPVYFNEKQLTFDVFNNQTDLQRHGYGYSEVEASLYHLKYHMDTEQFNANFFSQGGTTRGILVIDPNANGSVQQNAMALSALRRQWQSTFSGNNGAWKIPVISASSAQFVNMTQSSKDME